MITAGFWCSFLAMEQPADTLAVWRSAVPRIAEFCKGPGPRSGVARRTLWPRAFEGDPRVSDALLVWSKLAPGTVSERPKEHVSKTCDGSSRPWVQIPPVPPRKALLIRAFRIGMCSSPHRCPTS